MELFYQASGDAILLAGLYGLMAVGMSLSFGIIRLINFAHGEMIMLGAYGAFWMFEIAGIDPLVALTPLIVMGFLIGWVIFRGLIGKVLDAPHVNQILLTFGLGLAIQNLAVILWTADSRSAKPAYATSSSIVGPIFLVHGRVLAFVVAATLIGGLIAWLKWSETGRATRAVAENRAAATLMGINVNRIYALATGLSCALGVATGVIVSFILTITPFMGFPMLVKAIAIVILGGMGSVAGTAIGACALAFGETFVAYYVTEGSGWGEGISFILIIALLILRPRGILGESVET